MKSLTEHLWFEVPGRRGFINITSKIEQLVARQRHAHHRVGFHQRDESGLHHDYEIWLEKLAPHEPTNVYRHNRTGEDNADAHLKRQLMGREVVVASAARTQAATRDFLYDARAAETGISGPPTSAVPEVKLRRRKIPASSHDSSADGTCY